jgi:hypothetical protein
VSKKTGELEPEPENPGNRGPGFGSSLEKPKNRVLRFRYPVFTGLPGTGFNIYFLFLVRALHFTI